MLPEMKSFNVIGEMYGSEFPDQFITVGGHLDSWDVGEGAHDDGVGCMQSIDVLRIFKALKMKPRHTIRVVMFMDEEMAQRGGQKYKEMVEQKQEKIIAAIEADGGGFCPIGFGIDAADSQMVKLLEWKKYFEYYGMHEIFNGWGGVDIEPLKELNIPLFALVTNSQRYFDYQHSAKDTFDKVNKREMQLGSGAIAALVYLIDQYGFKY
jgi:carboxypeptidase Q